jgi:transcription elongation factor GreA
MSTPEFLTKEKYAELEAELEQLSTVERQKIAKALEEAKALGDLSENAEYHAARDAQAALEDRIRVIEEMLHTAKIVEESAHKKGVAGIGSHVTVKLKAGERTFTIVGAEEADIAAGKISNQSPLGAAIMGKIKGDSCEFETPAGKQTCAVLDVK